MGTVTVLLLALTCLQAHISLTSAFLSATAMFNHRGVSGNISFYQGEPRPSAPTRITVSLRGLNNIAGSDTFQWHVHDYPFPNDGNPSPCGSAIVGGHYDPLGAAQAENYATICNPQMPQNCEIGDLSGKFGNFQSDETVSATYTDQYLSLSGVYSIIGRSIVIHFENGSRFVCANIADYNTTSSSLSNLIYSHYRDDFIGNIFFRQYTNNTSSAFVYTDLVRIVGNENSSGHNWHVHDVLLDMDGTDCSLAGPHYNPREVDIADESYLTRCGSSNASSQMQCEIGDLSNKGAPFNVNNRVTKQLYTDTDLPLFMNSEGYYINERSTVIHAENLTGPRIACANLTTYQPLEAISRFNENGVSGSIRFYQHSPFDSTRVFVSLQGLQAKASGYHVHAYSVGPGTSPERCANKYAGGHWNPHGIVDSGTTSDQFEIGDLSGKFGSLAIQNDVYREYVDPNIPLFGPYSIIGRSIVIHMNDDDGTRWVCSDIERIARVVEVTTPISTSDTFSGSVTFLQPADQPYAETTIVVEINVDQMNPLTANADGMVEYQWSYKTGSSTDCSTLDNLRLYSSNMDLCSPSQQLACENGDLSGKHGNLLIPKAANTVFRAVFTDANLPLSARPGLNTIFGTNRQGRLYITPAAGDNSPAVCAQSNAASFVAAPPTDATPTDGTPAMIPFLSVIMFSICLVYIASAALSW